MKFKIVFPNTKHDPLLLQNGANLAEELTTINSPVLFGCRTGICGTCLVRVEDGCDELAPPNAEEKEALEVYASEIPNARLACQIALNTNISISKVAV